MKWLTCNIREEPPFLWVCFSMQNDNDPWNTQSCFLIPSLFHIEGAMCLLLIGKGLTGIDPCVLISKAHLLNICRPWGLIFFFSIQGSYPRTVYLLSQPKVSLGWVLANLSVCKSKPYSPISFINIKASIWPLSLSLPCLISQLVLNSRWNKKKVWFIGFPTPQLLYFLPLLLFCW